MSDLQGTVRGFLALPRIAVVGVSRSGDQPANLIYRKLAAGGTSGRRVFAVNARATSVEGTICYPSVRAIPGGIDGAVIVTPAAASAAAVEDCAAAGARQVWLHRSFGEGSVSGAAIERGRALGLVVIPGACPMMFCEPVDFGHRCMRAVSGLLGGMPSPVRPEPAEPQRALAG
jgi:acyl-CoA synthetase (NDP forming)